MGKIKINETASELLDMKNSGDREELDFDDSGELIMPIEHYVNVSAKVENPEGRVSVEGAKSAPRKKATGGAKASGASTGSTAKVVAATKTTAAGRKKALALPAGSIGAAVINEKEKAAAGTSGAARGAAKAGASSISGKKASMDGMVRPKARTVEVTEIETTAEDEFEAHRPREKKEEPEEEGKPRFSKVKAALIGAGVAIVVAVIGVFAIGFFGKKETPRCIVQFESNGGTKIESEEVICGETVGRPDDPTKDGFTFQNWIYGGSPFDFDQMTIDEDMILVAKWQVKDGVETVKVHFDANGGELAGDDEVTVKKGGTISEPVEPTQTSYEFVGWKLDGEDFDFSQPIEEDVTLVAEWEAIAGGSNGGQSGGSSSTTTPEKPSVESLAVADSSMKVGDTKRFDVTIKPSNAKYKLGVSSSSSDVAVCSVVDDNRLQCVAKAPGETTILLRDSLSGKNTQFKLTVTADVTFVEMNKKTLSLYTGDTETLKLNVTSSGAAGAVKWESNNPNVATVDQSGKVTAVSVGTARITATVGGMSDSCSVTVLTKPTPQPEPEPEPEPEPQPQPEPTPDPED